MKYFYDTEFIEGKQRKRFFGIPVGMEKKPTIDLISIGIVAEDGREYYGISKDFNLAEAWNRYDKKVIGINHHSKQIIQKIYWIRQNVLFPIFQLYAERYEDEHFDSTRDFQDILYFNYSNMKMLLKRYGRSNEQIAKEVNEFICYDHMGAATELWAYYGAYDHVVLMWLWGKMINKPKQLPMFSWDLKQMIDKTVSVFCESEIKSTSFESALNRIKKHPDYPNNDRDHDALADARWNKKLYNFLKSL